MATVSDISSSRLSLVRLALTGALVGAIFFGICWVGAFIPKTPGHMYLQLFTTVEMTSSLALVQGLLVSAAAGAIFGALIASIYNALAFIERR
jgi:hypothetical protein